MKKIFRRSLCWMAGEIQRGGNAPNGYQCLIRIWMEEIEDMSLIVIAGPCVIESENMVMEIAGKMKEITSGYDVDYYFKASFDKANRTSLSSYRGPA